MLECLDDVMFQEAINFTIHALCILKKGIKYQI